MKISSLKPISMKAACFCAMLFLSAAIASCSDSDSESDSKQSSEYPEQVTLDTYDDLSFFQNSIIEVDELGNIEVQHYGEILYADDPEHLYIGVDSYEEAEELFREWIAPDVKLGTTAPLTASLTDEEGKSQGTITFAKGTESGHVAEVTASSETQLKKFSRITFLLNSAWPFNGPNAKITHRVGDIIVSPLLGFDNRHLKDEDKVLEFVCIRSEKNGQKPIFISITKNDYVWGKYLDMGLTEERFRAVQDSRYCPGVSRSTVISKILQSKWDFYCDKFDEVNCGSIRKNFVWIGSRHRSFVSWYNDYMALSTGEVFGSLSNGTIFSDNDIDKILPFLFTIDWMTDAEVNKMTIATAGTNIPGITEVYANLFDNSIDTKWYTREAFKQDGVWFVEFNLNYEAKFQNYSLYTALDADEYPERNPVAWTLKGKRLKDDEWVVLDTRDTDKNPAEALPASGGHSRTYAFNNNNQYRYFRFEVSRSKGDYDMQLSRLVLSK